MKALLALVVVPFCAALVGCGGSSDSGTDESTAASEGAWGSGIPVSGTWVNSTPCNTTFYDPNTGHLKCDGFTSWKGTFVGSSHYFFDGYVNQTTGNISGTLSETFSGSGLRTSGTFHMHEWMTINASTGAINISSTIDSGTGGYWDLRGHLTFTGTSDTSGIGTGTYSGSVTL